MELDPTVGIVGGVVAIAEAYKKGAKSFETWRKGRKTRKSAEEELQTSLDVSGEAVEWEYRKLEEKYGDAFKHGDDASKTALERIAKDLNSEVINVLVKIAIAPKQKTEMEPVDLWKRSEEARSTARRVMFDLCQRLDSQARANRPRAQSTQAFGPAQVPSSRTAVTRPEYYSPGTAAPVLRHSGDFGSRPIRENYTFPQGEERKIYGRYNHRTASPIAEDVGHARNAIPRPTSMSPHIEEHQTFRHYSQGVETPVEDNVDHRSNAPSQREYMYPQAEDRQSFRRYSQPLRLPVEENIHRLEDVPPRRDYTFSPVDERQAMGRYNHRTSAQLVEDIDHRQDVPPKRDHMFPPGNERRFDHRISAQLVEDIDHRQDAPQRWDYTSSHAEEHQRFDDVPQRRDYVVSPIEKRQTPEDILPRRDYMFPPVEERQNIDRYNRGTSTSALGNSDYVDSPPPRPEHLASQSQERVRMPRIHPRFSRAPSPQVPAVSIPERPRPEPEPLPSTPHSLVPGGQLYNSKPPRLSSPAPPSKMPSGEQIYTSNPARLPSPAPPPKTLSGGQSYSTIPPRLPSPAPPPKMPLPSSQPQTPFASQLSPKNFPYLPQSPPPPPKTAAEVLREAEWEEATRRPALQCSDSSGMMKNPRYSVGPPGPPRPPKPPPKQLETETSHRRNASAPNSVLLKKADEGKDVDDEVGYEYMIPPERAYGGGEPW